MRKAGTLATTAAVALGMSLSMASFSSFAGGHCPVKAVTDGPKLNWKLSLWGKRRAFTEGMEFVSEHIKACTGGNFTMKLFYGEQLSKSKENLDGIKLGAFEAATFCAAYHPGKNAPLNVLDLPFLPLADFGVMRKAHDAIYAHPASQKALAQWNAHLYMSNILPQYEYMGRGPVPKAVSDFSGKRLRALGGMGRAAKLIGATPSSMPASETYTALQRGTVDAIVLDFHAEATSEKMAMGHFVDGRVSLCVGTHTHVPTADAMVLPGGTAYQSDTGMCGDYDSVIGMDKTVPLARFTRKLPTERLSAASGEGTLCGVFVETDDKTGLARRVEPVRAGGRLVPAP